MAKRRKKRDPDQLTVQECPGDGPGLAIARSMMRPTVQGAATLRDYGKGFGELDLMAMIDSLTEQTQAVIGDDLGRGEAMLTAQAHTLDAIYNNLARRAITADYMSLLETYLKLALRAQSQCRATWEALATIKNPPMMGYVKQANIAHGHQQVNNAASKDLAHAENENPQNKQLEENSGERLDPGATSTAGGVDPAMATVGEIDGAEDEGR